MSTGPATNKGAPRNVALLEEHKRRATGIIATPAASIPKWRLRFPSAVYLLWSILLAMLVV